MSRLPRPAKVLLVSRGNRLLERALRSVDNVELAVAAQLAEPADDFDFVVLDGITPAVWPKGNVLAFKVLNTNWVPAVMRVEGPPIVDWKSTHPLLRYVGFDNVQVASANVAKAPSWAVPGVDSPQASLILAGEIGRQRLIWVGFDPLESNWPLRISFPIFVANAVEWLNPANAAHGHSLIQAGDAYRLPLLQPEPSATVTYPGGATRTLPLDATANEFVFGDTARSGIYRVRLGTNETAFCVNLLSAPESNIRPRDELQFGAYEDYKAVHALQDQISIVPLSSFGKPFTAPPGKVDPALDGKLSVRDRVNAMDAASYFALFAELMKANPPAAADAPMVARLAKIGIVPGKSFDATKLDAAVAKGIAEAPKPAQDKIMSQMKEGLVTGAFRHENGWLFTTQAGLYGTEYRQRALITAIGLGANRPQDAVYPS